MSCKSFEEIYKEVKPYKGDMTKLSMMELYEELKNLSYEEAVDAYTDSKQATVNLLNTLKPRISGAPVQIVDVKTERNAQGGVSKFAHYMHLKDGKPVGKIYRKNVESNNPFTLDEGRGMNEGRFYDLLNDIDALYSDMEFIHEGKEGYEQVVVDGMNNPEKLYELGEDLAAREEIDNEHKEELLSKLKELTTTMADTLPAVSVFLKENVDEGTSGKLVDADIMEVMLNVGKNTYGKSALEVYLHELYHAVTKSVIDNRDPFAAKSRIELEQIKDRFLKETTEEDLDQWIPVNSKQKGKDILDYLADPKVGLHEFVAYAMTNKAVMKGLKELKVQKHVKEEHPNLASKLIAIVRDLYEFVMGKWTGEGIKSTEFEKIAGLVYGLANASNKAMKAKRNIVIESIIDTFTGFQDKTAEYIEKKTKEFEGKPLPTGRGDSTLSDIMYIAKLAALATVNDNAKNLMEITLHGYGIKPEGSFWTIMKDMSKGDEYADLVERMGMASANIDRERDQYYKTIASSVRQKFNRELSKEEDEALASIVLDLDLSAVWHNPNIDLSEVLVDDKALDEAINSLKKDLKSRVKKEDYNFYDSQTGLLAKYMVTNETNIAQLFNAYAIAIKAGSIDSLLEVDPEVVTLIDQIATLKGIKESDPTAKETVADLIINEKDAMELMISYHIAHKANAEEKLFNTRADKVRLIKGYSKETYDSDIDVIIAPLVKESEMNKKGYKLVEGLNKNKYDGTKVEMGFYASDVQVRTNLHKVSLRYTNTHRKGTSLTEVAGIGESLDASGLGSATTSIVKMRRRVEAIRKQMEAGTYTSQEGDYGLAPILDNLGEISDFRYMMRKQKKIDLLGMNREGTKVLGRSYQNSFDKVATKNFNEEMVKLIKEDAEKNAEKDTIIGKNNKIYAFVSEYSGDKDIRDLWKVLPSQVKEQFPDGFHVRRDLKNDILGYREISIADAPLMDLLPEDITRMIRIGEAIWKELVGIAKVDIIIRIPGVLLANIISNLIIPVVEGYSIKDVLRLKLEGTRELNAFIKKTRRIIELEGIIDGGKGNKTLARELSSLKNDVENSPVKDLIDEGFYSTIIEDVSIQDYDASNKFTRKITDKFEEFPEVIQTGVNWLFVNERTAFFKLMDKATHYSDFVARYAQYHLMLRDGMDKKKAVKLTRDAFINYNKPNSRFVEYMNQMGFIMFTKYFTRIQRAIHSQGRRKPYNVLLSVLGQEFITGDLDDITDASLFAKDYGNIFHSPLENLMRATTPSGAEAVFDLMKII